MVLTTRTETFVPSHRSMAEGAEKFHGVPHSTVLPAAQASTGGVMSRTVTVNEQLVVPTTLLAVQVTRTVPTVKALPDGGMQATEGAGEPVTGTVKNTTSLQAPMGASTRIGGGQESAGATFTVKLAQFVAAPNRPLT